MRISQHVHKTFPCPTVGSHYNIKLHDLQEWDLTKTVNLVKEETILLNEEKKEKLTSPKIIQKIHEVTNHKNADNLIWAFKCTDILDADLRKTVNKVVSDCKICKKFRNTFPGPNQHSLKVPKLFK